MIKIKWTWWMNLIGYKAMVILGLPIVIYRGTLNEENIRHEKIHMRQALVHGYVLFWVLYCFFWVFFLFYTGQSRYAYSRNPFEVEAHTEDKKENYWPYPFSWVKYLNKNA